MKRRTFLSLLGASALSPILPAAAPSPMFAGRVLGYYRGIPIFLADALPEESPAPALQFSQVNDPKSWSARA